MKQKDRRRRSAEGERDMNFWPDFIKLKTSVGGNREQYGYEETFGQPREEQQHITVPAKHIRRMKAAKNSFRI
jgi:hypothetical protein